MLSRPLLTVALVALTIPSAFAAPAAKAPNEKPWNVLFIAVDDLSDWVGAFGGNPQAVTPNIDRLAKMGVSFQRAYCASPVCNTSRTALLTGLRATTTGIYSNGAIFRDNPKFADHVTLPQAFKNAGYSSFAGGKIFHQPQGEHSDPVSWSEIYNPTMGTPGPPKDQRPINGIDFTPREGFSKLRENTDAWDWGPIDTPKEETNDWKTAAGAAKILTNPPDHPFFLAAGIFRPHLPFYAPREFFDRFPLEDIKRPPVLDNDREDLPAAARAIGTLEVYPYIAEAGQEKAAIQGYLASTAFADACIGLMLDALEKSPERENTIIVLWGDHGWHFGDKKLWSKNTTWERSCRVPFIMVVPGLTPKGVESRRTVNLLDIYPTLAEIAGIPAPGNLDGRSLVPLLKDPGIAWPYPSLTIKTYGMYSVRSERHRYIRYRDNSEELYDHDEDPHEWHNLVDKPESKPIIAELRKWTEVGPEEPRVDDRE